MKQFTGYMHGVNLGGWLSQCDHTKERYDSFITKEDIAVIKDWGMDHIRVPVDYDLVEDKAGNYKDDGFAYIEKALEWTGEYGLNMVLDLHRTFGYSFDEAHGETGFFDNEDYQERFYRLWEEFARRFGKYDDRLCFELLNEVTSKSYCERWNRILTECIKRIRVIAPTVKILVGGYYNNSIMALKDLCAPYDENVVYNFHCYEPLVFTHQGAYWTTDIIPEERMAFEESVTSEEYFEELFSTAIAKAEKHGSGLYCGEYGCIDVVSPEDTIKWYRTINAVFRKHDIGRAAWNYKAMDFGLSDDRLKDVHDELINLL